MSSARYILDAHNNNATMASLHFCGHDFVLSDKDVNALNTLREMSNNKLFETVWQKGGNFRELNRQYNWLIKHYCEDYGNIPGKEKTKKRQFATRLLGIMTEAGGMNYELKPRSEAKVLLTNDEVISRITKRLYEAYKKRKWSNEAFRKRGHVVRNDATAFGNFKRLDKGGSTSPSRKKIKYTVATKENVQDNRTTNVDDDDDDDISIEVINDAFDDNDGGSTTVTEEDSAVATAATEEEIAVAETIHALNTLKSWKFS